MSNTRHKLLRLAERGITPYGAVRDIYPQSKQPLKKAKTFAGYLESMERDGLVRHLPEHGIQRFTTRYILTPLRSISQVYCGMCGTIGGMETTPLQDIQRAKREMEQKYGENVGRVCVPELRPLVDWLEYRERFETCPTELLPVDLRRSLEQIHGPADTCLAIIGSWAWPAMKPDGLMVVARGGEYECLVGMTRAECNAHFRSLCFPS